MDFVTQVSPSKKLKRPKLMGIHMTGYDRLQLGRTNNEAASETYSYRLESHWPYQIEKGGAH